MTVNLVNQGATLPSHYRIDHISDIHFWNIPMNPFVWRGKRVLGLTNLLLRRARKFRLEAIPELLAAIEADHPDHLVVSGDISTTALETEFNSFKTAFHSWLQDPALTTIVCGNHDRYTRPSMREKVFESHFDRFNGGGREPFLKPLTDGLLLVGVDPCRPNPLSARGWVTPEMAGQLQRLLDTKSVADAKTLVLVCHYPAEVPPNHAEHQGGHRLEGANLLLESLRYIQVPLYWLHGHIHHPWRFRSPLIPNLVYLNPGAPILRRSQGYSLGRWVLDWDGQELRAEWKSLDHAREMLDDLA